MPTTLDYTSRDFDGLRSSLLAYASQHFPDWTPASQGDFGVVLLELLAYVGDVNSYYVDRAQQEAYITTATQRSSILQLAKLLGYQPGNGAPARGTVSVVSTVNQGTALSGNQATISAAGYSTITPGTQFATDYVSSIDGQIIFEYLGTVPVTVPVASSNTSAAPPVAINVVEGKTIVDPSTGLPLQIGISDGTPTQFFRLPNPRVYTDTVQIWVAGVPFSVVPHLLDWNPGDQVCGVFTDDSGYTWVQFGDNLNGAIPGSGLAITAKYRVGFGAAGNLAAGLITTLYSATPGVAVQTNPTDPTKSTSSVTSGGADPESINQIRLNASQAFYTQKRLVTINDYNGAAIAIPGVQKANSVTSFYTSVNVFILGADGSGTTQIIPPPQGIASTASGTGGTLAAGTYYYVVTATNANGETVRSVETSQSVTGTTSLTTVSWTGITGATGYKIYRGTVASGENGYFVANWASGGNTTTSTSGQVTTYTFTDSGAAITNGNPPVSSTATVSGGATSALITNVFNTLQSEAMAGVSVQVAGAVPVQIDIGLSTTDWPTIQVVPNYSQATVANAVYQAIQSLFSLDNISIGMKVPVAQIYQTVMSVPGVLYCSLPALYRDDAVHSGLADIQLQPWEYPVLNPNFTALSLTMNGGF